MSRLLVGGQWYDLLGSNAYWEAEYERVLLQRSHMLFPEFHAVPFKITVTSENSSARPDIALVDAEYRTWWVGEVELAHHSLGGHVLPQILTLRSANYGESEAIYLAGKGEALDVGRVREMMRGSQPNVFVVVNGPVPWDSALRPLGVLVGVVEIYRSARDEHILRAYGEFPRSLGPILSYCFLDAAIPRLLAIESPARLPPPVNGKYELQVNGSETVWEPVNAKDRMWLSPVRTNPLTPGTTYALIQQSDGRLGLEPSTRREKW